MIVTPVASIAQTEEATPPRELTSAPAAAPAQPASVPVEPTTVPVQPTSVPAQPTTVPVQPTMIPPTVVPTAIPTQVPPTAVPTVEPTAVPTEIVWVNSDSLRVTDGVTVYTVQQGGAATVSITYTVTTPRSSTIVYASLSGESIGWTISSPSFADADPGATTAAWTQAATLTPNATFTMPIVITAPVNVAQDHGVSLHLWSTATAQNGQETGVPKSDLRIAAITALAPLPTPTPTVEPTALPTQEPTSVPVVAATPEATEPVATPTSSPTPSPTLRVARSAISPTSLASNSFCLAGSVPTENSKFVIAAGGTVTFNCELGTGENPKGPFSARKAATNSAGWDATVDNNTLPYTIGAQSTFIVTITAGTCEPGAEVTYSLDFYNTSEGNPKFERTETFDFHCKTPVVTTSPSVSIQPFSFGSRTWDGYSWGTTTGTGGITVQRSEAGDVGTWDIRVQAIGRSDIGLNPQVTSSSTTNANITAGATSGDPNITPVWVANVKPGFSGEDTVQVSYSLTPTNDVPEGPHNMTIEVSIQAGA